MTSFISPLKTTPYAKYQDFAPSLSPELTMSNPTSVSLFDDMDTLFAIGSSAGYKYYGPQAPNSQSFMAQKCAENFDGTCEFLSTNNRIVNSNVGKIHSPLFKNCPNLMTIGDTLVENTAQRRFCDVSQCKISKELFNPLDPSSPMISTINCGENNIVCMPPANPDSDLLLNKILDRPDQHVDLLLCMYRSTKNNRNKYVGTRIGRIFDIIEAYYKINQRC